MKIHVTLWLLFVLSIYLNAQVLDEKKYLLTTKTNTVGISTLNLVDPYLSPLVYNGLGVRYDYTSSRYMSAENMKLSTQNNLNFVGGYLLNPAKSASMIYAGVNLNKGFHYHFQTFKGLRLLAGGSWDVDFGYKMIARNINNPVNIDLATNLNMSGVAKYNFKVCKKILKLQLTAESPLAGCMFVPRAGASYYEMFDLWNLSNTTHFSSLHNKRGLQSTFSVNIPLNNMALDFGIRYHGLKYTANEMVFRKTEFSLIIGTKFDVATFAGRKNVAPRNFISTNE